jgi:hypothetical protein
MDSASGQTPGYVPLVSQYALESSQGTAATWTARHPAAEEMSHTTAPASGRGSGLTLDCVRIVKVFLN